MPVLKKLLLSLIFALCANMASAMFIQPDWLDPTEPGVGTNRHAYSGNDPINKLDPSGNSWMGKAFWRNTTSQASKAARTKVSAGLARVENVQGSVKGGIASKVETAINSMDKFEAAFSGDPGGIALSFAPGSDALRFGAVSNVNRTAKRAGLALSAFREARRNNQAFRKATGAVRDQQAHHVIPVDTLDHDVVQKTLEGGFKFNGSVNGVAVARQAGGGHKAYTGRVRDDLDGFLQANPKASPQEAREFLEDLADDYKDDIVSDGLVVK